MSEAEIERRRASGRVVLSLQIADGWHVNSAPGRSRTVSSTRPWPLGGEGLALKKIANPEGEVVSLGFQDEPLRPETSRLELPAAR